MFVLRTIIDSKPNTIDKTLYACFVDFQKAFDSVIHSRIKYLLLENNIGGKFYDIIKHMFEQNEVYIKVDINITPPSAHSLGLDKVMSYTLIYSNCS